MDQLEYKPNLAAKSLVQKKSNLIGVVFKEENDNSYEKIVKGIEKQIRANGEYDFLTMTYQRKPQQTFFLILLQQTMYQEVLCQPLV